MDTEKKAKSYRRSRAVGQMFKQTSNYLTLIWDLEGVLSWSSCSPYCTSFSLIPFSLIFRLVRQRGRISFFFFPPSIHLPPLSLVEDVEEPAEDVVGLDHVKSPRHAFHLLLVLSRISLYVLSFSRESHALE